MSMNFRLYLMRHAKTEDPGEKQDFERVLTAHGENQAALAGEFMKDYQVDKMIVSYVKRAMQTAGKVAIAIDEPEEEVVTELYQQDEDTAIALISHQEDHQRHLLVIGHNPTIYRTALKLADESSAKYDQLMESGMPPAQIVVLDFHEMPSWESLSKFKGEIIDIFTPE